MSTETRTETLLRACAQVLDALIKTGKLIDGDACVLYDGAYHDITPLLSDIEEALAKPGQEDEFMTVWRTKIHPFVQELHSKNRKGSVGETSCPLCRETISFAISLTGGVQFSCHDCKLDYDDHQQQAEVIVNFFSTPSSPTHPEE